MKLAETFDCHQQSCFFHQFCLKNVSVLGVKRDIQRMSIRKGEIQHIQSFLKIVLRFIREVKGN